MTPRERSSLAEQLRDNPLLVLILDELERAAINQCVHAKLNDDDTRRMAAFKVQAIRAFRSDLTISMEDNRARKGAPA